MLALDGERGPSMVEPGEEAESEAEVLGEALVELVAARERVVGRGELALIAGFEPVVGLGREALLDPRLVGAEELLADLVAAFLEARCLLRLALAVLAEHRAEEVLERADDLGRDRDVSEVRHERVVGCVGAAAEGPSSLSVVVPHALAGTGRGGGAGERLAGARAEEVAAERELLNVLRLAAALLLTAVEGPLHGAEGLCRNEGLVDAIDELFRFVLPTPDLNHPHIHRVTEHLAESVAAAVEGAGAVRAEAFARELPDAPADLVSGEVAGRREAERFLDERGGVRVWHDDVTAVFVVRTRVARWWGGGPAALAVGTAHAAGHVERAPHVLGLRHREVEREERPLLGDVPVDGLLDGDGLDAEAAELADDEVGVAGVAAEPAPVLEEEDVYLIGGATVGLDVTEEGLEAGAVKALPDLIPRLCAEVVPEGSRDLQPFGAGVALRDLVLGPEAEPLALFFGAHPGIADGDSGYWISRHR